MKREASTWGYNWATFFRRDVNTGPGPPGWGSLESETVKYGHESRGTQTPECAGEGQTRPDPDPTSPQRGCYIRTMTASVHLKKITGRESQGACR
jgi:hypothetical protein